MPSSVLSLIASPPVAPIQADHQRIIRAIASSTAIETGQNMHEIERWLHADNSKYQLIDLATLPAAS